MISEISLQRCEFIPNDLEEGTLYFSERFRTTSHLCACGCGNKVVISVKPQDWTLEIVDEQPTVCPSVGNRLFECKSHYYIREGHIIWLPPMSAGEVERSLLRDEAHREKYFSARRSWVKRLWASILDLVGK
ncbi:DUF6527 family protein [Altererythrobacter sp.]|uniref:DUF6527 family protein n=1 Tax=Altererythrobacter sp. TaxID=1872480 RepID=UPI003D02D4BF